jgi:hypothetical protein
MFSPFALAYDFGLLADNMQLVITDDCEAMGLKEGSCKTAYTDLIKGITLALLYIRMAKSIHARVS